MTKAVDLTASLDINDFCTSPHSNRTMVFVGETIHIALQTELDSFHSDSARTDKFMVIEKSTPIFPNSPSR